MHRLAGLTLAIVVLTACTEREAPGDESGPGTTNTASSASPFEPGPVERAEILAPLQSLFDALESGDDVLLRSVVDPSVVMHFSEERDGTTTFGSSDLEGLATRISASETPLIERMWDPVVSVDGTLATIWTPYDFYAGDAFSHCGVDAATLMRSDDGWKIVALSWTRRQPPACDLHPDGPPAR